MARIRGAVDPCAHNARTIAAATSNPGCDRRAVLDAAGVDKRHLASHLGWPSRFGQSRFAIARGLAFESRLMADGGEELTRLLAQHLDLPEGGVPAVRLGAVAGQGDSRAERVVRTRDTLLALAKESEEASALLNHPLLRVEMAGAPVYLEPDLIVVDSGGRPTVVEIKSFAVIDGQADATKIAAAATQAAVYLLALRTTLDELGLDPDTAGHLALLVCPRDFTNQPVASLLDLRKHLSVVSRQLGRMRRVDSIVAGLPEDLTLDLAVDAHGVARRPPAELTTALMAIDASYVPECLSTCELAAFCRAGGADATATLGAGVREQLGGLDQVSTALALASGARTPPEEHRETAAVLRQAWRLRAEALALAGPGGQEVT